ncbi:MAG: hypothetical protein QQN63_13130, partial [Nitrosopumilus sp.]
VFIAIFLTGNLFVWGILRYADFVDTVDEMDRLDLLKDRENIELTEAIFGDSARYTSNPAINSTSGITSDHPLSNMNLTESTEGWSFTKKFPTGVSFGLSGGFDEGAVGPNAVGSPSGPGIIFVGINFLPESGTKTFVGNWTTRFFVDLSTYGITSGTYDGSITLSWASNLPSALWNNGILSAQSTVYVISQDEEIVVLTREFTSAFDTDTTWNFDPLPHITNTSGLAPVPPSFWGTGGDPGQFFSLTISTNFTMKPTSAPAEVRMYFDDIGLIFEYGPVEFADVEHTVTLGSEDVGGITGFDVNYASAYSRNGIKQILFIKDWDSGGWERIAESIVSGTTSNFTVAIRGSDSLSFINSDKEIQIRILATSNSNLVAFSASTSSLTIQDFFGDPDKVTVIFENNGDITARIVSLWIIDSNGATN